MFKILLKKGLKFIYKLPEEEQVTFIVRWIVHLGLKMLVSLYPISLSSCNVHEMVDCIWKSYKPSTALICRV